MSPVDGGNFPFNDSNAVVWLDEVLCHGYEDGISNCAHLPFGDVTCYLHDSDAGVICTSEYQCHPYFSYRSAPNTQGRVL